MNEEVKGFVEEYLNRELESMVHQRVKMEEEQRFRQLKWVVIVLGIFGLGSVGTISNYFVEKTVDDRIASVAGDISSSIEFSRFVNLALRLDLKNKFSDQDVDLIMNYLRQAEGNPNIRLSREFVAALSQVTQSFTASGQSNSLDEIVMIFEREIMSSSSLIEPLLHHYGQEVIAQEVISEESYGYEIFAKLERAAPSSKFPELALAYRVLYESKRPFNENHDVVEGYIKRSVSLNDIDRQLFFSTIIRRAKVSNWVNFPDPQSVKIEEVVREFLSTYKSSINVFYDIEQLDFWDELAAGGFDDELSDKISTTVSRLVK